MVKKLKKVKRTERGWPGHFICCERCVFHRNTLLECGKIRIVISSVGMMINYSSPDFPNRISYDSIGAGKRMFETMVFHAKLEHGIYWDADVSRSVDFTSDAGVFGQIKVDSEMICNNQHEAIVSELTKKLQKGIKL